MSDKPAKPSVERLKLKVSHLDSSLYYMYVNRRWIASIELLEPLGLPSAKMIHRVDCDIVLQKLLKDGLVMSEEYKLGGSTTLRYSISFDGVLFMERASFPRRNKPYANRQIMAKTQAAYKILRVIMIALNAVIIIILTYMLLLKPC